MANRPVLVFAMVLFQIAATYLATLAMRIAAVPGRAVEVTAAAKNAHPASKHGKITVPVYFETRRETITVYKGQVLRHKAPASYFIYLPATIDGGRPVHLVLDTGAYRTFLSAWIFKQPIRFTSRHQVGGVGQQEVGTLTINRLEVAGLIKGPLEVDVGDFSQIGRDDVVGLLGQDFLSDFKVLIDYKNSQVTFEN